MAETEVKPKASERKEVKVTDEDVARFAPRDIKTPDDAVQAYLQGLLEEDELRKALSIYGVVTLHQVGVERPDAAYERKIPDDLFDVPTSPYDDFAYRKELLDEKQKTKDEAVKKTEGENPDQTKARETAALTESNTKRS